MPGWVCQAGKHCNNPKIDFLFTFLPFSSVDVHICTKCIWCENVKINIYLCVVLIFAPTTFRTKCVKINVA